MSILKDLPDLLVRLSAKVKATANWAYMHPSRRIGTYGVIVLLLAGVFSLSLKYLESQVSQATAVQLAELRWLDMENRASQAIDALNLCIATPSEDDHRGWYCEEAINLYTAEAPAVLPERATKIIQQQAYPMMVLQLKASLRWIAYERTLLAKPSKEALMLKGLIQWTWLVMAVIILVSSAWLGYLYRQHYRVRTLRDSLPHLENVPPTSGRLD